jgi:hypothetical protein
MRLGTAWVSHQHLLHHDLCLLQSPALRCLVDLVERGLCLCHGTRTKAQAKAQQGGYNQPFASALTDGFVQHVFAL